MGSRQPAEIIVVRLDGWSDSLERHLSLVGTKDPIVDLLPHYRAALDAGKSVAYGVFVDGEHVASIVTAVYAAEKGAEWVIEMAGSEDKKRDLLAYGFAAMEELAYQARCVVVRFQTSRPGLVRLAEDLGYRADEVVMRKVM